MTQQDQLRKETTVCERLNSFSSRWWWWWWWWWMVDVEPQHNKKWDSSCFHLCSYVLCVQELATTTTTTFFFWDFYPNNTFSSLFLCFFPSSIFCLFVCSLTNSTREKRQCVRTHTLTTRERRERERKWKEWTTKRTKMMSMMLMMMMMIIIIIIKMRFSFTILSYGRSL